MNICYIATSVLYPTFYLIISLQGDKTTKTQGVTEYENISEKKFVKDRKKEFKRQKMPIDIAFKS